MIPRLDEYAQFVGAETIAHLRRSALPLHGKRVVHVNATNNGGGVAEILNTLVFLMNDLGLKTGWRVLLGSDEFFAVTKGMHNSLQGASWRPSSENELLYLEYCHRNALINHLDAHDFVIIHDPQPLAMIAEYPARACWLWRCHIDVTHPNRETLDFLLPFIKQYEGVIVSTEAFRLPGVDAPQFTIAPSIDPLAPKNAPLDRDEARRRILDAGIPLDKPLIVQVSRFDPWKDPLGVLAMYERIREREPCRLVLIGSMASDDPEGPRIYLEVKERAERLPDVHVLTVKDDSLVNALQQEAAFVFQNSLREGFGLTVSEALWKGTPVLAKPVGGISLQVLDGETGFLYRTPDEGVEKGVRLLQDAALRSRLGAAGREHVRKHFLVTRHVQDYVDLLNTYLADRQTSS